MIGMIGSYDSSTKIVTDGLVLWNDYGWDNCFPSSGTVVHNLVNNGFGDGDVAGGPSHSPLVGGGAFTFTGSQRIGLGNGAPIKPIGAISVGMWIKCASFPVCTYASDWHDTMYENRWMFNGETNLIEWLVFDYQGGGIGLKYDTTNGLTLDLWHYIVGTFDHSLGSNQIKLYADGVLAKQADFSIYDMSPGNSGVIQLGDQFDPNDGIHSGMNGSMSQFHLYDRALTPVEIAQNFNAHRLRYER